MRRVTTTIFSILCTCIVLAQSNASTPMNFHIEQEFLPPYLSVVDGTVLFSDANGNDVINANEDCSISFQVQNKGKGNAYGCNVRIVGEGSTEGLSYSGFALPAIKPGNKLDINIPINASMFTANGEVQFTIQVDEPNGFGTDPIQLKVHTHKFDSPFIEIVSYKISSDGETQLRKKKSFKLQILLQNTDQGVAHDVTCQFAIPENMFLLDGEKYLQIPTMQPNEKKLIEYEFQTNANVPDQLTIPFELSESYGKFAAKDSKISLTFGQPITSGMTSIQIAGKQQNEVNITKASLISDVDENIPSTDIQNVNTFALVIANENYQRVASVPFALNDGNIFREYCLQTLGIPEKHIHFVANATYNQIKSEVNWLKNITETFDDAQILLYYAGHGIPDEASKTAYLLPVDGSGSDVTTGYKLDELYSTLGQMPASQIIVFMDACFSGSKRENGMLASARGVALKARAGVPQGNMVVFSAAQGDETAYPNTEKQHGLFTYYLLKKLQETEGDVSLKELGEYIEVNVKRQSILLNSKLQTPCVIPSVSLTSPWQSWKLR